MATLSTTSPDKTPATPTQSQTAVPITDTATKTAPPAEKKGVPLYLWIIGGIIGIVIIGFLIWTVAGGGDSPEPVTQATPEAMTQATLAASQADATAIAAGVDTVADLSTAEAEVVEEVVTVETAVTQPTQALNQTTPPENPSLGSTWQRPTDGMMMVTLKMHPLAHILLVPVGSRRWICRAMYGNGLLIGMLKIITLTLP